MKAWAVVEATEIIVPSWLPQPKPAAEIVVLSAPIRPTLHDIIAQTTRNLEAAAAFSLALAQGWHDFVRVWWGLAQPWLKTGVDDLYGLGGMSQDWLFAQNRPLGGGLHSPGWIAAFPGDAPLRTAEPIVIPFSGERRRLIGG